MGHIPGAGTDLSTLEIDELKSLKTLLLSELAMSKARQQNIKALLKNVRDTLKQKKKK